MDAYYHQQAHLPHFSSHSRQKGSGIGAVVTGIGRVALPFARKVLLPAAKKIGRELLLNALPELVEVATKRKTLKQASRDAVRKTAKRQLGGGKTAKRQLGGGKPIKRKRKTKRSRSNFFSNVRK